jgi:hypothetical protein
MARQARPKCSVASFDAPYTVGGNVGLSSLTVGVRVPPVDFLGAYVNDPANTQNACCLEEIDRSFDVHAHDGGRHLYCRRNADDSGGVNDAIDAMRAHCGDDAGGVGDVAAHQLQSRRRCDVRGSSNRMRPPYRREPRSLRQVPSR